MFRSHRERGNSLVTIALKALSPDCYLQGAGVALAPDGQSLYSVYHGFAALGRGLDCVGYNPRR
jgi:hypothetical protein